MRPQKKFKLDEDTVRLWLPFQKCKSTGKLRREGDNFGGCDVCLPASSEKLTIIDQTNAACLQGLDVPVQKSINAKTSLGTGVFPGEKYLL